jgi:Domain of unknown function (DUF4177)
MHDKAWLTLVLICLGLALLPAQKSRAQTKARTWEYKTLVRERYIDTQVMAEFSDWSTTVSEQDQSNPKLSLDAYLNQLGAAGWELVAAAPMEVQRTNVTNNRMYYVFKRAK